MTKLDNANGEDVMARTMTRLTSDPIDVQGEGCYLYAPARAIIVIHPRNLCTITTIYLCMYVHM